MAHGAGFSRCPGRGEGGKFAGAPPSCARNAAQARRGGGGDTAHPLLIANEALEAWIGREIDILEDLQAGLDEGRAGKAIPHDKAMRQVDGAIERAGKRNGRRKAIRK